MGLGELFVIAVGLSMDAFAVSICKGLSVKRVCPGHVLCTGVYFGGFQMMMPLIGYFLGSQFSHLITRVDHWIAFILLGVVGANMIRESFGEEEEVDASFQASSMLPLAVATSIDALAVGITLAFLEVNVVFAICFIGCTTFSLSGIGVMSGNILGKKFKSKAEIAGGIVLICIGSKILLEHLGYLG